MLTLIALKKFSTPQVAEGIPLCKYSVRRSGALSSSSYYGAVETTTSALGFLSVLCRAKRCRAEC